MQPGFQIGVEQIAHLRLDRRRQNIDSKVSRVNCIGFPHDQIAPRLEPRHGASKGKTQKKTEKCEDRTLKKTQAVLGKFATIIVSKSIACL